MDKLETIFRELKSLLKKHSPGFDVKESIPNSTAKIKKEQYHLYGKKIISIIPKRKPQPTYVSGIIKQKDFIGFYSLPIYSHPNLFLIKNETLKKSLKGKSCFHIRKLDEEIVDEIESLIVKGIELYRKEGWI